MDIYSNGWLWRIVQLLEFCGLNARYLIRMGVARIYCYFWNRSDFFGGLENNINSNQLQFLGFVWSSTQDLLIIHHTIRNLDYCALYLHYLQSSVHDYIGFSWWNDVNFTNLIHKSKTFAVTCLLVDLSTMVDVLQLISFFTFHYLYPYGGVFFGMILFLVICKLGA